MRVAALCRIGAAACVGALVWSSALRAAEPAMLLPKSGDQGFLAAELGADGLWLHVCAEASCAARQGQKQAVPAEVSARRATAVFDAVELEQARKLMHVRVPLAEGQWEALLAARPGRLEPLVVFAGRTGYTEGVDGERRGAALQIVRRTQGERVLVGEMREDVNLCGRPTLLGPRLLTPAQLELEPASAQRLGAEERRAATALRAERMPTASPASNPLRAVAASSALGDPGAISDGDPSTRWSEARAGAGRGEFVVLRAPADRPLSGFDLLLRAAGAGARVAAPRDAWLATRSALYRVSWPEDAVQRPGAWYHVQLPAPVYTDCVALVLERADSDAETAEVGVAELIGRVATPTLAPELAAARLDTPGADGDAALAALLDAGEPGIAATLARFEAQGSLGRQRALEVLERGSCERVASVYARLLSDPVQGSRAERRLRQCGAAAAAALVAAYEQSDADGRRALLPLMASIAPAAGIPLFAAALQRTQGRERDAYRDAFSAAARRGEAHDAVARELADTTRAPRASLELLRLLGDDIVAHEPAAGAALARIVQAPPIFAVRFLALAPAARLSSRDAAALEFMRVALQDPDPHLRAEAVRRAPANALLLPALVTATGDAEVRVRAAAAERLGELGVASAESALVQRLAEDRWPLVRAAAASALAHVGTAANAERVLVGALDDASPGVRRAALFALGARGALSVAGAVAARFQDDDEAPSVRAAAAQTLAALCTQRWVDDLTAVALWLREPGRPDPQLDLARASLSALGHLAPPDLQQRLQPLREAKVSPLLRPAIEAALHDPERCNASPRNPGHPTR
jgi:HEAT repeat protein